MTPCLLVICYGYFGGVYCLHVQGTPRSVGLSCLVEYVNLHHYHKKVFDTKSAICPALFRPLQKLRPHSDA
jgi:hypothetical protein